MLAYAELDLEDGNYISAFLNSYKAIRLAGDAILVAKGYYAPSTRHIIDDIFQLHAIQEKYDEYVANPDTETIIRDDAIAALTQGKRLLRQIEISPFTEYYER
jgi:HEPN domain-containing protein